MSKLIDLTGKRFGKLEVIRRADETKCKQVAWICKCDCSNEIIAFSGNLKRLHTQSCGCHRIDTHTTHGDSSTRLYGIWNNMIQRCNNPNNTYYRNYGAKGITVCEAWKNGFKDFRDWALSNGYSDKLTIERKNNDEGYSPDNCIWVTRLEQSHNTSMPRNNTSGVKGVYWDKQTNKWKARITANHKSVFIGYFDDIDKAYTARKEAETKYWGKTTAIF